MLQEPNRIKQLNDLKVKKGKYVLYWMQSSQRVEYNHALIYAIKKANKLNQPLLVTFGLTEYPEANMRHYKFMLEGLTQVQKKLLKKGAGIYFKYKDPIDLVIELLKDASLTIIDRGYLRINKKWYKKLIGKASCPVVQVESNLVVPVETASIKEEYSAATLRRKITPLIDKFLNHERLPEIQQSYRLENNQISLENISDLKLYGQNRFSSFKGSYSEARKLLEEFIALKLDGYHDKKNDPTLDFVSNMSPYLHFGQISPVEIALIIKETDSQGSSAYLEELIIRRELAVNFVHYNQFYDSIECLPEWCLRTLNEHITDSRQYIYTKKEFENSETHDPYWNAAQKEMVQTGKMHGYMRMYWGKKIIEWTKTPKEAYKICLFLNNKYELDGRDPNGYAGVAWCFGKHDRPWKERPIFGKIRYMNDRGLERKFKIKKYAERWIN
jgi:deoxyribodipyrimidine photo-lyase